MQYTTLLLSALSIGSAMAQSVKVHVVMVANNGTLTFSPNKVTAAVGDMVQYQFMGGNHTVTQSTFDQPCAPIDANSNVTGIFSGFQPVTKGATTIPTYTIQVNNTTPIWVYCSQAKHCQAGMVMVINENTTKNATRSVENYASLAAKATANLAPSAPSNGTEGSVSSSSSGSTSSGSSSGSSSSSGTSSSSSGSSSSSSGSSGSSSSSSGNGTTTSSSAGNAAPSLQISGALTLGAALGFAITLFM